MHLTYELVCEICNMNFVARRSDKQAVPRFCGNACKGKSYSIAYTGAGNPMYGRSGELCPSFGVKRSAETRAAIAATKRGRKFPKIGDAQRGVKSTWATRQKQSATRRKNILAGAPLHGFVKKQYIQGWYRGAFFRSSYELAFVLKMENAGRTLGLDLLSEHVRIPYALADGSMHVYVADFFDTVTRTVYEVKHSHDLSDPVVQAKHAAACNFCVENGCEFVTVTQHDLQGFLLTRVQVSELEGVELIPMTKSKKEGTAP